MTFFPALCTLTVNDPVQGVSFPLLTFYPTEASPIRVNVGPYALDASPDGAPAAGTFPVVLVSHGSGGSPLVYRTMAAFLARHGYIVALPEHPGNNRNDNRLEDTVQNLEDRPRHLRLALDALLSSPEFCAHARPKAVGVIGHSMGGYTALAVAGGQPWAAMGQQIPVVADARVKAVVLMAPATGWFVPNDSLQNVKVPILLFAAEHDRITPRWNAQLVLDLVPQPQQVTFRLVPNAGHFCFLSPFPEAMKVQGLPPALDPAGFDREKFHRELYPEVRAFFHKMIL